MHALLDSVVFLGLKSRVGGLVEQFEQDITIVLAMMFAKGPFQGLGRISL